MSPPKSVSIIIPVYNEKKTIREILRRVIEAEVSGLNKEIIVVDDGSTDGTSQLIRSLIIPGLIKILLPLNQGKGFAVRQGIKKATGDIVLIQDADLEYNPGDYPLLLAPFIFQGARVVYGSRELTINTHSSRLFFLGGKFVTLITRLLYGSRLTDVPTGYKVFDHQLLSRIPLRCQKFEFCPEITAHLLKRRIQIIEVPIRYNPRKMKDGKKIRLRDGLIAIWTLLRIRVSL